MICLCMLSCNQPGAARYVSHVSSAALCTPTAHPSDLHVFWKKKGCVHCRCYELQHGPRPVSGSRVGAHTVLVSGGAHYSQWLPLKHHQSHGQRPMTPSPIRIRIRGPPIATTQEQGPRHQEVFPPLLMPRLITGYGCTYYCCRSGGSKACGLVPWTLTLRIRRTALCPRRTQSSTILHRHWPTVRYCHYKTYCSQPKFRHASSPTWHVLCRYFAAHGSNTRQPAPPFAAVAPRSIV